jgi:hypothetical protein
MLSQARRTQYVSSPLWKPQKSDIEYDEYARYSVVQDERQKMNGTTYEELLEMSVEHKPDLVANLQSHETRYVLTLGTFTLYTNPIL